MCAAGYGVLMAGAGPVIGPPTGPIGVIAIGGVIAAGSTGREKNCDEVTAGSAVGRLSSRIAANKLKPLRQPGSIRSERRATANWRKLECA